MQWYQIVSLIVSILSLLGFGTVMKTLITERHERKKQETEEARALAKQEKQDEIREVIKEELKPVVKRLDILSEDLEKNTKGGVTLLRDAMKNSLDTCRHQHYTRASDRANFNELYKAYEELGGNHFKEYVDQWKIEMESFPTKDDIDSK